MILLVGALVLGFAAARLSLLPQRWGKGLKKIGDLALILLLFALGISMGANPEILRALPVLGLKALVFALAAIAGSVLLVLLAAKAGWGGSNNDN